jgi:hypothetical protein
VAVTAAAAVAIAAAVAATVVAAVIARPAGKTSLSTSDPFLGSAPDKMYFCRERSVFLSIKRALSE